MIHDASQQEKLNRWKELLLGASADWGKTSTSCTSLDIEADWKTR